MSDTRTPPRPPLVLGSTSPYRRALLARFGLPFETVSPAVDEAPLPDETPEALALRLACAKARSAGNQSPGALVIGSDQVAALDGVALGKPGRHDVAMHQLMRAAGKTVYFYTAVALFDTTTDDLWRHVDTTVVTFRRLSASTIERYLRREEPYDCAGSFKAEALGISLFEKIESEDPTALTGLPLIWLAGALNRAGLPVP